MYSLALFGKKQIGSCIVTVSLRKCPASVMVASPVSVLTEWVLGRLCSRPWLVTCYNCLSSWPQSCYVVRPESVCLSRVFSPPRVLVEKPTPHTVMRRGKTQVFGFQYQRECGLIAPPTLGSTSHLHPLHSSRPGLPEGFAGNLLVTIVLWHKIMKLECHRGAQPSWRRSLWIVLNL